MSDYLAKIQQINKSLAEWLENERIAKIDELIVLDKLKDVNTVFNAILECDKHSLRSFNEIQEAVWQTKDILQNIGTRFEDNEDIQAESVCALLDSNFITKENASINLNHAFSLVTKCMELLITSSNESKAMKVIRSYRKHMGSILAELKTETSLRKEAQTCLLRSYFYEVEHFTEQLDVIGEFGEKISVILRDIPAYRQYISYYTFNKAISKLKSKQYESCMAWFRECIFICSDDTIKDELVNVSTRARAHRYVSLAYILIDRQRWWKDSIYASDAAEGLEHHAENLCINLTAKIIGDYDRQNMDSTIEQIKSELQVVSTIFQIILLENLRSKKEYSGDFESIFSALRLNKRVMCDKTKKAFLLISVKYLIANSRFTEALGKCRTMCSMGVDEEDSEVIDIVQNRCKLSMHMQKYGDCIQWASALIEGSNGNIIMPVLCLRAYSLLMIDDRDGFENDLKRIYNSKEEYKPFIRFLEMKRNLMDGKLAELNQVLESIGEYFIFV